MTEIENITNIIKYSVGSDDVEIILKNESIWANQKSIAKIFSVERSVITKHLANIFAGGEDAELQEINNVQKMHIVNSLKPVGFYSLDTIISVGYKVNSKKATKFRQWATRVLTQYLKDGFVINEELLRSDPKKLNELAAKIRELRANEKNVYASVRECFKLASSDYEPT